MLWAAAMGIKVGGLSRCTASTARRPTTKWGLVLRFSARMRAACDHETSSRLYSLFNKSSGGNTCEILYNYAWNLEFRSWFCANRGGAFLFLSKGNFYRSSKRIFGSSKSWKLLNDPSRIRLVFQLEIYIPFNFWWIGRNSKSSRDLEIKEVYVVFNKLYKLVKFLKRN